MDVSDILVMKWAEWKITWKLSLLLFVLLAETRRFISPWSAITLKRFQVQWREGHRKMEEKGREARKGWRKIEMRDIPILGKEV
jgi:hypothetical protein